MFGYGVFFKVFEEKLEWSRTLLSSASALAVFVMGVFAIPAGRLSDRFGPRWILTATGLTTGVGYLLMSQMEVPWQLLVCFGFLVGLGFASHDVVTLSTVSSWYPHRRGFITGIIKTGSACGQILVPLLVTVLVAQWGWRSALLQLGVVVTLLLVGLAQLMERNAIPAASSTQSNSVDGFSFQQALGGGTLWILCAIQFCFLPSMMTVPLHIVAHATDLGMQTTRAATVLSVIAAASVAGRLSVGSWVDHFGGRLTLLTCLSTLSVSLIALRLVSTPLALYPVGLIYGLSHGGLFTAVSPAVAEYFGMKSHGSIFGTIVFFGTLSGAAGPMIAGVVFDRFGSYDLAFTCLAGLALTGLVLSWMLPKSQASESRSTQC